MTIRRSVDLNQINQDYSAFREALFSLPARMFPFARRVRCAVDDSIDALERAGEENNVGVDRCDMIREVEVLTFDMLRRTNESIEIEQVIAIGRQLYLMTPADAARLTKNLTEAYEDFAERKTIVTQIELEEMAR